MTENITIWLTSAQTAMKTLFGFLNEEKTESSSDFRKNDTLSRRYKHTRPSKRRNSGTTPESNRAPPPFMVKYVSIHDVPEVFTKKPRDRSPFSGKTKVSTPCIVNYVSIPNHPDRPKDRVPSHELYKGITANHPSQQVFIKTSPKTSILLNKPANKKISEENLPPVSESFAVIKNPVYKSVARKRSRGIPYYASFVSLPKSSEENLQPVSESITVIKASVYESVTRKRSRGIPYYASFVSLPKLSEENIHPVGESIMVTEASVYGSVSRKRSRGIPYYASLVSLPKASEENLQPVSESLTAIKTSVYESVSRKRSRGFPYYASFTSLPKISVNADDLSKRKLDYASLEKISFWSSTSLPNEEISEKTIDKDLRQHLALSEPSLPNESMQKAVKNYDVKTEVIRQRTVDVNDTSTEPVEPRNEGWDGHPVLVNKICPSSTSLLDDILEKTIGKDLRSHLTLSEPSLPNESLQEAVKNYDVKGEVIRQRAVDGNDTSTEPVEPRNEEWDGHQVFVNKISSSRHKIITESDAKKIQRLIYRLHRDLSYFYFSDDSSTSSMVSAPDDTTAGVVAIPLGDTLKEGAGKVELDQNAKGKLTTDESPEKQQEFSASTELAKEPSLINVKLAEIPIVYHDVSKEREMKPVFSKLEEEGSKTSFSERMPSSAVGIESFQEPPLEAVQEFFEHILVDHAVKAERTSAAIERLLDKMEKEDVKTESNESMASRSSSEPSEESSLDVIDEFVKEDLIHPRIKEEHTDVATPRSLFEPKEAPLETELHSNEINHEAVERLSQRQQEDSQQNKTYNYKLKHADIVSSSRSYTSKRKLVKSRRNTGSRHIEAYSYKPLLNLTFARFLLK